jgi:iron only hydrogenase large subunit-like protein
MTEHRYHALRFDAAHCTGCMSCARICPTQAIRVPRGHAVMLEDRCIDCGECFKACQKGAVVSLTETIADLSKFAYKVAVPSPALYAEFDPEIPPGVILQALKLCGFDDAVSMSSSCGGTTVATELFFSEYRGQYPLISSFCPAVVRLIQIKYPDLVEQIMPILSPREVAAKEIKAQKAKETGLEPEAIAVVYITPCPAKMVAIASHPGTEASYFDSAVSIRDIFQILASAVAKVRAGGAAPRETESSKGLSWAYLGGVPRMVPAENSLSVAGMTNVIRILDDIEKGRLRGYAFVECHGCPEGCVSGALTVENPYVARARAIRLSQSLGEGPATDRESVEELYRQGFYHVKTRPGAQPLKPLDSDISRAITKMKERDQFLSLLPGIDCGACGAPSCEAFAEDVVLRQAEQSSCVFIRQRQVTGLVERLSELVGLQPPDERVKGGWK